MKKILARSSEHTFHFFSVRVFPVTKNCLKKSVSITSDFSRKRKSVMVKKQRRFCEQIITHFPLKCSVKPVIKNTPYNLAATSLVEK